MTQSERKRRVLIVSADRTHLSGQPGNLGDALLTGALADELEDQGFFVRIADFGPSRDVAGERHVSLAGVGSLLRMIRAVDAVVIGGGTLVQDDAKSGPPWKGLPRLLMVTVLAARLTGTKVAMFGVGSNPVRRRIPKLMLRVALAGTRVWVRDQLSADLLKTQWGKGAPVAADTALLQRTDDEQRTEENRASDHGYLLVAAYAAEIAGFTPSYLDGLRRQFGALEFISMHQGKNPDAEALPDSLRQYFRVIHDSVSLPAAIKIVDGATAVLSSRMHALYLGLLHGKPLVCLSDRPKVQSFRNEFAIPASDPAAYRPDAATVVAPRIADRVAVAEARRRIDVALGELTAHLSGVQRGSRRAGAEAGEPSLHVLMGYSTSKNTLNPFTSLLSQSIRRSGDIALDFTWRRALFSKYDVIHIHWPEHLIRGRGGARGFLVRTLVLVLAVRLRARRIPVVRTVHNLNAHERLSAADAWLLGRLERLTSARVVMNGSATFKDSVRTELIPHGHYRDWYGIEERTVPARANDDQIRLLLFGLIRRYKGVETLVSAFRSVPVEASMTLRIMGSCQDQDLQASLRAVEAEDPRVTVRPERIPDEELLSAIQESDVVVLPYVDLYNSGALLLALSCGTPVLLPESAAAREYAAEVGEDWIITYDGTLTGTTLAEVRRRLPDRGAGPDLSGREWRVIGERHHDLYRDLVTGTRSAAGR